MNFAQFDGSSTNNGLACASLTCETEGETLTIFGYARVSTEGQTLDAQVGQLRTAGCTKVLREKISGSGPIAPSWAGSLPK